MASKRSKGSQGKKAKVKPKPTKKARKAARKATQKSSKAAKSKKTGLDAALDPQQAKRMALLQLRIGRASHLYSMAAAFALATSGIILLLTQPGRLLEDIPKDAKTIFPWLVPIMAGSFIATSAFYLKWRPYAGSRLSGHFLLTLLAFLGSIGTLLMLILQSLRGFNPQALTWLYPASLSGISLTLISLAMTWRGLSRRKILSILSAAFPMAVMVYGFTPIFSAGIPPDLLILTFMGSAVAVLISGSMLHIIASSTSVQQREVIRVSNDRLLLVKEQLKARADALNYKEEALRSKEADLEVHEKALAERIKALEDSRKQLETLQTRLDRGLKDLKRQEDRLQSREAEIAATKETLSIKEQELAKKEKGFGRTSGGLSKREADLAKREKDLKKALIDLQAKEKDLSQKERELSQLKKEQTALRKQLEKTRKEVLEKESELQVRESALVMKKETIGLKGKGLPLKPELKRMEGRLLDKEKELSQKEIQLRTMEEKLKEDSKKAKRWEQRASKRLRDIEAKQKELTAKEKNLAERETTLEEKSKDLERQLQLLEESVANVREKEEKYQELYKRTHSKASSVTKTEKDVKRKMAALKDRESELEKMAKRLEEEREALTSKHQKVLKKEKDLEARESEVKLRAMEMESKLKQTLGAETGSDMLKEKERALHLWEQRLKKKEQEIKNRLYQKEKELKERERAIQEGLRAGLEEVEVEEEVVQDKIKSGTPRLDDLLLGGIPLDSQILFVGPAFVGKEIGILNFIAEGLKNGIPCILITTSRPPAEMAKDMGPILPAFREYEQLGLVRWIDGSTPMPNTKRKSPIVEGNTYVVKGAGDYEGILSALNKIVAEFSKEDYPYIRLAYMTLSTSLTQGNEKEALSFVQRFVNKMRKTTSVGIYAVERGMHSDQQIEALEHQMDGAIHFKVERQKNHLSVVGIGDVQTRGWVEYKYTNRALMIGAFMLERIR
ncbi:MAG: ATPase domain-containing protein [Thermoplasmata archaeon]